MCWRADDYYYYNYRLQPIGPFICYEYHGFIVNNNVKYMQLAITTLFHYVRIIGIKNVYTMERFI